MNYIDMHCDTLVKAVEQKKRDGKKTGTYDGGCRKAAPVRHKSTVFVHVFTSRKKKKTGVIRDMIQTTAGQKRER